MNSSKVPVSDAKMTFKDLRVAIVHYWLLGYAGGERVVSALLEIFPQADLFALAVEQFDLRGYDLVISSESGPAKGVITSAHTLHSNYCHSPMRYIWDLYHEYTNGKDMNGLTRPIFTAVAHYMRMWDLASASRVDSFVANSKNIAARIRKHYRRDASVIYPPVDVKSGYV